jgi:hypothetical protein
MITPEQRENANQARGLVLLKMTFSGALNDETMPEEKMRIFQYKAFADWPEEMQDQLRPFGAALIDCGDDEPEEPLGGLFAQDAPAPAAPSTPPQEQKEPPTSPRTSGNTLEDSRAFMAKVQTYLEDREQSRSQGAPETKQPPGTK